MGKNTCSLHGGWKTKKQAEEGTLDPISPSRVQLQSSNFIPLGPTSYKYHHFLQAPKTGDQIFNT
jgi:hypothetical protein